MKKLAAILVLFSIAQLSFSQNYEATHYTVEDGLLSNEIINFYQDSLGVIWLFHMNGMSRVNGNSIETTKGKLVSSGDIFEFNGNYISNTGKPALYNLVEFDEEYINSYRSKNQITSIVKVILEKDSNKWEIKDKEFLSMPLHKSPILDKHGFLWALEIEKNDSITKFLKYNNQDTISYKPFLDSNNLRVQTSTPCYDMGSLFQDQEKNIYFFAKDKGIYKYNYKSQLFDLHKLNATYINDIQITPSGNTWVSAFNSNSSSFSILNLNQPKKQFTTHGLGLIIGNVGESIFFVDYEGLKYIKNGQMNLIKKGDFLTIDKPVWNGSFQVGANFLYHAYQGTIYKISEKGIVPIYKTEKIKKIFLDLNETLWLTTYDDLVHLIPTPFKKTHKNEFFNKYNLVTLGKFNNNTTLAAVAIKDSISKKSITALHLIDNLGNVIPINQENFGFPLLLDLKIIKYKNTFYSINEKRSFDLVKGPTTVFDGIDTISDAGKKGLFLKASEIFSTESNSHEVNYLNLTKNTLSLLGEEIISSINLITKEKKQISMPWSLDSFNIFLRPNYHLDFALAIAQSKSDEKLIELLKYDYSTGNLSNVDLIYSGKDRLESRDIPNYKYHSPGFALSKEVFSTPKFSYYKNDSLYVFDKHFFKVDSIANAPNMVSWNDTIYTVCEINGLLKFSVKDKKFSFNKKYKDYPKLAIHKNRKKLYLIGSDCIEIDLLNGSTSKWSASQGYQEGEFNFVSDSILHIYGSRNILVRNLNDEPLIAEPGIHFNGCRMFYESFDWNSTQSQIVQFSGNTMPYNMNLDYNQNHLTFDYLGVSHTNKKPLLYFHKLVGLDTNFVGTNSNSATYSNLNSGNYTFQVYVQDENNYKSRVISCSFKISPPFWETWWFISLCILSFGSILYAAYQYNIRRLLARQEELEQEVENATVSIREQKNEIEKQRDEIEETHKEITDSIAYAKRIQSAILPPLKLVKEYLQESFVLYKPKDVVAGDFYWMLPKANDGSTLFAAADCTGHGVPGAMVSVVCNSALNRAVKEFNLSEPGEILTKTRDLVIEEFEKSDEEVKDGMDIALCSLRTSSGAEKTAILKFAGAYNPLWIIRNGATEVEEIKAHKQAIGLVDNPEAFPTHEIQLNEGDAFYIFSDGYVDQFGGERGKKYKAPNFRRLLVSMQDKSMEEQHQLIGETFEKWRGSLEQIDDVCIIGVRI